MAEGNSSSKASLINEVIHQVLILSEQMRRLETAIPGPSGIGETRTPAPDNRILEHDRTVPTFYGNELDHVAEDWIKTVDELAQLNDWPLRERVHFVRTNTRDAARTWFLSESFNCWDDLLFKFREVFVRKIGQPDRWKSLIKRTQGSGEDIGEYFHDKMRLCNELSLSFTQVLDFVIQGIRSSDEIQCAMTRYHTSISAMLINLRVWEDIVRLRPEHYPVLKNTASHQGYFNPMENVDPMTDELNNTEMHTTNFSTPSTTVTSTTPAAPSRMPPVYGTEVKMKCFNCNDFGHISPNCPKPLRRPLKCSVCDSDQHSHGHCPNAQKYIRQFTCSQDSSFSDDDDNFFTASESPFYRKVYINEFYVTGLIDSSSSHVLVRSSMAVKSNMSVHPKVYPLYTVGNPNRPFASTIGESFADIAIDGVLAIMHKVLVVPDEIIPVNVLIGRTWLELPHTNYYKLYKGLEVEFSAQFDTKLIRHNKLVEETMLNLVDRRPITSDEETIDATYPKDRLDDSDDEYEYADHGEFDCPYHMPMSMGNQSATSKVRPPSPETVSTTPKSSTAIITTTMTTPTMSTSTTTKIIITVTTLITLLTTTTGPKKTRTIITPSPIERKREPMEIMTSESTTMVTESPKRITSTVISTSRTTVTKVARRQAITEVEPETTRTTPATLSTIMLSTEDGNQWDFNIDENVVLY